MFFLPMTPNYVFLQDFDSDEISKNIMMKFLKTFRHHKSYDKKFGPKLVSINEAASKGIEVHIKSKSSSLQSVG